MSGYDIGVRERMEEYLRLFPPSLLGEPIEELVARHEDRLGTPTFDTLDLGRRRRVNHEHAAGHTEDVCGVGAGLGGIPGADGEEAARPLLVREGERSGEEAADLEA